MPRETAVLFNLERPLRIRMHLGNNDGYSLQSEPLLAGDDGTVQTVRKIRELVNTGKNDPRINHFVGKLFRDAGLRSYDRDGERRTVFAWVLRNIRFQQDPTDAECLRPPITTLQWGFGDCDDINAILLPSLLKSAGHTVRLVTISSHPAAPRQFSHVYCEVFDEHSGRWIPLDAARRGTSFGSAPSHHFRKRVWSLESDSYKDLAGLGSPACGGSCSGCSMRQRSLGTHMRLGRYYRSSGLGQDDSSGDGFDWSSFAKVLTAAGNTTANIVRATQAPAIVFPSAAGYPQVGVAPSIVPGGGVSAVGSVSANTLLLLGAAVVGVVLLTRRTG